jgi:two-component system, cell cycle response regulator
VPAEILVIEDNEANLELINFLLSAHGYTPHLATDGKEGLALACQEPPDLVLLDLRMPGMDGYEVAAAIRARPELAQTRIVAVTASAMVGDRERIAAAGFNGYIQKPIDPETFISQVERFLAEQPDDRDVSEGVR